MIEPSSLSLRIVDARSFFTKAPDDVSALLIGERAITGGRASLCAVGDIGLSGRAAATAQRLGSSTLFADVAESLRKTDVVFGNLECPLAGEIAPGNMFAAPGAGAMILRDAGFTVLHLANNHVGEYLYGLVA